MSRWQICKTGGVWFTLPVSELTNYSEIFTTNQRELTFSLTVCRATFALTIAQQLPQAAQ